MPNTPVFTNGVKYIKIAKQDSGSVDNSIELQDLTDIRIKFSDINNPVQYNVASITEYSTYYLYSIFPLNVTSSADQEILDYKIDAYSENITILPNNLAILDDYSNQPSSNIYDISGAIVQNLRQSPSNISLPLH
jgi:hypothetical protein